MIEVKTLPEEGVWIGCCENISDEVIDMVEMLFKELRNCTFEKVFIRYPPRLSVENGKVILRARLHGNGWLNPLYVNNKPPELYGFGKEKE